MPKEPGINNQEIVQVVKFSYNWNKKLDCFAYTTIRIHNPKKYVIGVVYDIHLQSSLIHQAQLITVQQFLLHKLTEGVAMIDTGYNRTETIRIITKMYKSVDFSKVPLAIHVFKRLM